MVTFLSLLMAWKWFNGCTSENLSRVLSTSATAARFHKVIYWKRFQHKTNICCVNLQLQISRETKKYLCEVPPGHPSSVFSVTVSTTCLQKYVSFQVAGYFSVKNKHSDMLSSEKFEGNALAIIQFMS